MKHLYYTLFVALMLGLVSCEQEPETPVPNIPPGVVNFYLTAPAWSQDSLSGLYVGLEQMQVTGPRGKQILDGFKLSQEENLLDYTGTSGLLLGTVSLPAGNYTDFSTSIGTISLKQKDYKVTLCHIPPGNPSNAHSIRVDACSVPDHTAHGDIIGGCGYYEGEHKDKGKYQDQAYSYITFKQGYSAVLFARQAVVSNPVSFEVIEGDTINVAVTINLANSFTVVSYAGDKEDHDDDRIMHWGKDKDDDDDKDEDDDECSFLYVFDPVISVEALAREGSITGAFEGNVSTRSSYTVYVYPIETYFSTEANRNNPFPNAMLTVALDKDKNFAIEKITQGTYDFVLAEFVRDRFVKVIGTKKNALIEANHTNRVTIQGLP